MNISELKLNRYQYGLTLVELMIAVVLSMILLGGTIAIFMSTKQVYKTQEELARIQENLRYGITQFTKEASRAGFMGCLPSVHKANSKVTNVVTSDTKKDMYDFSNLITGVEGDTTKLGDPDSLTLRFALPDKWVPVVAPMKKRGGQTYDKQGDVVVDKDLLADRGWDDGDVVAVSDCDATAMFVITDVVDGDTADQKRLVHEAGSSGKAYNKEDAFDHQFGNTALWASAMVYEMDSVTFELDTKSGGGKAIRSLYATRFNGNRELILAGVEDFQVKYGVDRMPKDGTADRYLDWDDIPANQVNEITSLRVKLTVNPGLPVPGTDGIHPTFRKTTEFTVKLRNRNGDA